MDDVDRFKLLHGPYAAPKWRLGERVYCLYKDSEVEIGGLHEAPIPWPRVRKGGSHSLVVYGDLVTAIQTESEIAVSHHWGVGLVTVWSWRKALGIGRTTDGTSQLHREYYPVKITPEARAKMTETVRTPEAREAMSTSRVGKPVHPATAAALLVGSKQPKSDDWKAKAAERGRKRYAEKGHMSPESLWTTDEDAILGTRIDREIALQLGRTIAAVRGRRKRLDIKSFLIVAPSTGVDRTRKKS